MIVRCAAGERRFALNPGRRHRTGGCDGALKLSASQATSPGACSTPAGPYPQVQLLT